MESTNGNAAHKIIEYVKKEGFDLVVLGAMGESELKDLLLGSVAHTVARHAPCPFYAKEILSQDRGLFYRFADAKSIAECIDQILRNNRLRRRLERNALAFGKSVEWSAVAERYGKIFESITHNQETIDALSAIGNTKL